MCGGGESIGIKITQPCPNSALPALQIEKCNLSFLGLDILTFKMGIIILISQMVVEISEFVMCQCG